MIAYVVTLVQHCSEGHEHKTNVKIRAKNREDAIADAASFLSEYAILGFAGGELTHPSFDDPSAPLVYTVDSVTLTVDSA